MATVVSPVTQIAETAVNIASARFVASPDAAAAGSISNVVVMTVKIRKVPIVRVEAWPPRSDWALKRTPRRPPGAEVDAPRETDRDRRGILDDFRRVRDVSHDDTELSLLPYLNLRQRSPWYSSQVPCTLLSYDRPL
jgi:hypothetical protein